MRTSTLSGWARRALAIAPVFAASLFFLASTIASAATLEVGSGQMYATPCAAFAAAADGDTIEIAAQTYSGDVCRLAANQLTIRGIGGRPKIDAAGKNFQGKGTWVVDGNDTTIDNVEMLGATVPDHNGAAVRLEGNNLTMSHCYIHDNEEGLLTGAAAASSVIIEYSEFANNGYGDGQSHNMYIGHIASFTLRFSYSHHAKIGHDVKSRANHNELLYNRISDESNGTASYEVNLPNGGTSLLIGNLIQQGPKSDNSSIIAYAEEGATNPGQDLYLVNNTVVNDLGSGLFVQMAKGTMPAVLRNNIFFGGGTVTNQMTAIKEHNVTADPLLVDRAGYDYHLRAGSPCIDAGGDPGTAAGGEPLAPVDEYVQPTAMAPRTEIGAIDVGAYEFGSGASPDGGSGGASDAGAAADGGSPQMNASDGGRSSTGGSGCDLASTGRQDASAALPLLLALLLFSGFTRRKWLRAHPE